MDIEVYARQIFEIIEVIALILDAPPVIVATFLVNHQATLEQFLPFANKVMNLEHEWSTPIEVYIKLNQ